MNEHTIRWGLILTCLVGCACGPAQAKPAITPTDPPSLSVRVDSAPLAFDPPEVRDWQTDAVAPRSHASWYEPWQPWPRKGKDKKANTIELGPRREGGAPILGALFRSVLAESVVVTSADGSKTFVMGEDYAYNAEWGQIANLKDRLGPMGEAKLKVRCRYATQRIDLIQRAAEGRYTVKRGTPAIVCPRLPEPDEGCVAVAGVYIAPWRQDGKFAIAADNILPILPAPPVAPINPEAVSRTRAKLIAGQPVTIAIMGASATLGAEAGPWWDEKIKFTERDQTYRGRVIYGLRTRFPAATITPVEAYQGGTTTQYGLEQFRKVVQPAKADLVWIMFGLNDASSAIGRGPRNTPARYKELMTELVVGAKQSGCEVMLVVAMQPNPWLKNKLAERWPAYRQAMLEIGREQDVAVADVYAEWMNMATRGIPPYSQLHNWSNHPGAYGHKVFADVILRFFEPSGE